MFQSIKNISFRFLFQANGLCLKLGWWCLAAGWLGYGLCAPACLPTPLACPPACSRPKTGLRSFYRRQGPTPAGLCLPEREWGQARVLQGLRDQRFLSKIVSNKGSIWVALDRGGVSCAVCLKSALWAEYEKVEGQKVHLSNSWSIWGKMGTRPHFKAQRHRDHITRYPGHKIKFEN